MPELLERGSELQQIGVAVAAARAGSGRVLLVEGAAGVGKTALLNAAIEEARRTGFTTLSARASELETGFAWAVMRQLFEPLLSDLSDDRRRVLFSDAAGLTAPVLGLADAPPAQYDTSFAAIHGLYWLAANASRTDPLLLAVDDVQWADAPSLRSLAFLVNRLEALHIGVVLTARSGDPVPPTQSELLARLTAEPNVIVLRPVALSVTASGILARETLGEHLSGTVCRACHERTGGNPFLLRQLVDSLRSGDELTAERIRDATPEQVSRNVLVRLSRLPSPALELARAAAVLGTRADLRTVAAVAQLDEGAAQAAADSLISAGILEDEAVLVFSHPIVRAAVLDDMTAVRRSSSHRRAAELLERDGRPPEEVAAHLLATAPGGDAWVVSILRVAGRSASQRAAFDAAADYLRRASREPPSPEERSGVLLELGLAESADDPQHACGSLTQALALAGEGTERAEIGLALGRATALCGQFARAAEGLEQAIAEAQPGSTLEASLEAEFLNCARWDLSTRPRTFPVLERLSERAARGEQLDPRLHAQLAVEAAVAGDDCELALSHARRSLEDLSELVPESSTTLPQVISVLVLADLVDEAQAVVETWLRTAQRRGWPLVSAIAANAKALVEMQAGAISDAIAHARQSLELGAHVWIPPFAVAFLIEPLVARGEIDAALAELEQRGLSGELPDAWPFVVLRFTRARLYAAAGDHVRAIRELRRTGELCEAWGVRSPAFVWWRSSAAESLVAVGEREEAQRLAREELSLARRLGTARAIGVAQRAVGIAEPDLGALESSVVTLERSAAPLELARALVDFGAALRRAKRRESAREPLRRGLDLAHRLGALALAERAREELIVAGARPRRNALRGRDALTPSELRVARMAAGGLTNRQIAQSLFVTLRTVELHLTSAYDKLGISSRTQLRERLESG